MVDVVIIGAGVIGASVSRYLSKYHAKVIVLEKENDLSMGTSKANSGISHAGFDCEEGTLKAKFNVLGNEMMEKLSADLDFPYIKNGAFVLAFDDEAKSTLESLLDKGLKNGVKELSIISGDDARIIEPKLSNEVAWALYAKTSGIVSPYEMTIALAENACDNGVEFKFNSEVTAINTLIDGLEVVVNNNETIKTKVVINCSGMHSGCVSKMVGIEDINIISRKGEYLLLDKNLNYTHTTLFQTPTKMGKGILVAPTTHNNTLVGPTAVDINSIDDTNTTIEGLNEAWNKALLSVPSLNKRQVITQFSGLRSHEAKGDFIIGWSEVKNFYNVSGIESPGLTSAPAIGEYVSKEISQRLNLPLKDNFIEKRVGIKHIAHLPLEEKVALIKENPLYGHVICRCEEVTEGEIVDSINRTLGARDLDGVKRRTRSGMGRCQMGFCTPKIMEIIARELHIDVTEVTKKGPGSNIVVGKVK